MTRVRHRHENSPKSFAKLICLDSPVVRREQDDSSVVSKRFPFSLIRCVHDELLSNEAIYGDMICMYIYEWWSVHTINRRGRWDARLVGNSMQHTIVLYLSQLFSLVFEKWICSLCASRVPAQSHFGVCPSHSYDHRWTLPLFRDSTADNTTGGLALL